MDTDVITLRCKQTGTFQFAVTGDGMWKALKGTRVKNTVQFIDFGLYPARHLKELARLHKDYRWDIIRNEDYSLSITINGEVKVQMTLKPATNPREVYMIRLDGYNRPSPQPAPTSRQNWPTRLYGRFAAKLTPQQPVSIM